MYVAIVRTEPANSYVSPMLLLLALAIGWGVLTDGMMASWLIGIPTVLAAYWAARRLGSDGPTTLVWSRLPRFAFFFAWESMRGGIDVARRVLLPQLRVAPGFTHYRIRLQQPAARLLFANSVSLLPGTLAVDMVGDRLDIHALDTNQGCDDELRHLESAVARLFDEEQP